VDAALVAGSAEAARAMAIITTVQPRRGNGPDHSAGASDQRPRRSIHQHQPRNAPALRSQRHADGDLLGA
jgi:hypothetical protein